MDDTAVNIKGGEDVVTIDLPFSAGYESRCPQGVDGAYSHHYTCTYFDLDLDTPNNADDPVYAPIIINETCKRFPVDTDRPGADNRRTLANGALQSLVQKKIVFLHTDNRVALHDVPMVTNEEWLT